MNNLDKYRKEIGRHTGLPTGLAVGDIGRGRLDPFGGEHPPGGGGGRDLRGEFFLSLHLVQ